MSNNNMVTPKIGSLHYIWHFKMLMKCNANISIPGAMQNVNEMQM